MTNKKKPNVHRLLDKLEAKEDSFLQQEFLAPATSGGSVRVRIAGAVCDIKIEPADFRGWGIFRPESHTKAELVREATLSERRQYLDLFPRIRLIVCRRIGRVWFGSTASFGDSRLRLEGITPISIVREVQMFDTINARYDGSHFWFDEIDSRTSPTLAVYLRESATNRVEPSDLDKKGLTAEHRAAYELNFWELTGRENTESISNDDDQEETARPSLRSRDVDPVIQRLRESLSHAGANLVDYLEREDSCRVTFTVNGQEFTSSVGKDDLTVQVAGICLSGEDQKFDLASLVGVLREGQQSDQIYLDDY